MEGFNKEGKKLKVKVLVCMIVRVWRVVKGSGMSVWEVEEFLM